MTRKENWIKTKNWGSKSLVKLFSLLSQFWRNQWSVRKGIVDKVRLSVEDCESEDRESDESLWWGMSG